MLLTQATGVLQAFLLQSLWALTTGLYGNDKTEILCHMVLKTIKTESQQCGLTQ